MLSKMNITKKGVLVSLAVLVAVAVIGSVFYYAIKGSREGLVSVDQEAMDNNEFNADVVEPSAVAKDTATPQNFFNPEQVDANQYVADQIQNLTSEELLPKDESLLDRNFLYNDFEIGSNSRGSDQKNPNFQFRQDPVIEKQVLSPFNQPVIEDQDTHSGFDTNC